LGIDNSSPDIVYLFAHKDIGAAAKAGDRGVDLGLVVSENGPETGVVEDGGALRLWEGEVEKEYSFELPVKWDPGSRVSGVGR
jgi:hypothetical protein